MTVLLRSEEREYLVEPGEELQTDLGVLSVPEDVVAGDYLETHLGHPFVARELRVPDFFTHFERSGAPMLPSDIGTLIGEVGVQVGDRILDVGTGTGVLAAALARCGAEVTSYEQDPEAAELARTNFAKVELSDRVTVQTGDALEELDIDAHPPIEVLTLDTGDAPELIELAAELVVPGGFIAAYSPFVESTAAIVRTARKHCRSVQANESIRRELTVEERGTRPSTKPVGHTGYLVIGRRDATPDQ